MTLASPLDSTLKVGLGLLDLLLQRRLIIKAVMFGVNCGPEVDEEAEDVEREDKPYDPLKYGSCIGERLAAANAKSNCKGNLDKNEQEFDPERCPQDPMSAIV